MMRRPSAGQRIIAAGLVVGALLGLLGTGFQLRRPRPEVAAGVMAMAMFVWTFVSGVATWQGRAWGLRSTRWLLLLQIVQFSFWRFSYEFSNLFSLRLMAGQTTRRIGGNIGSSFDLHWTAQDNGWLVGVNGIAAAAYLYFLRTQRPASQRAALPPDQPA